MKRTIPTLKKAREANELARLNLDTIVRQKRAAIVAKYDATESSSARRRPQTETQTEDQLHPQFKRQLGVNIGRDLERNYSPARGILHQFRMNVVGELGKLQVNCEGGDEAVQWFNGVWAKDCDFRDDLHFSVILQNIVASVLREGDLLAVVDDGLIEDTGKLIHWEADQIVPLGENVLANCGLGDVKTLTQENGVIRGKWGKILGWSVTHLHGQQIINDADKMQIWRRENARHVKNPWRMNQGRGVASLLTSATNFLDLYEIMAAELASAKRAAVIAGYTTRTDAETDWDLPGTAASAANLPENSGKSVAETTAEGAVGTDPTRKNYERFENLTGGYWEYLQAGDDVKFPDFKRPNVLLAPFVEAVLGHAGASIGLARAYALLRADSNYTAFRGDMILSWVTFYAMQKWLEREYADWVAVKVLTWAQKKKIIKLLPVLWQQSLSWKWPQMPHVDEARESIAESQSLKNGTTDYSELLGPDWETKFKAYAKQLNRARELGLPLSPFEQKSGGAAPSETSTDGNSKKVDELDEQDEQEKAGE